MSQPSPAPGADNTRDRPVRLFRRLLSNVRMDNKSEDGAEIDSVVSKISPVVSTIGPVVSESSDPQKLCNFLKMLPLEIRQDIYRLLFTRPVPILPGPVHFEYTILPDDTWTAGFEEPVKFGRAAYAYQWNTQWHTLQSRDDDHAGFLPSYGGKKGRIVFHQYLTKPNAEQQALIDSGIFQTDHKDCPTHGDYWIRDTAIDYEFMARTPQIWRRGQFPPQILNRSILKLPGIYGTPLLRTCHQIHDEAIEFLYSKNTFAFDFRPESEWNQHLIKAERRRAMDRTPFSNLRLSNRCPHNKVQVSRGVHLSMEQFFDRRIFKARASGERYRIEPLAHFFNEIGKSNARRIKSVQFEGFFETYHTTSPASPSMKIGGGLDEVLLLAARALQKLSPFLEQLTLKRAHSKEHDRRLLKVTVPVSAPAGQLAQYTPGQLQFLATQPPILAGQSQGPNMVAMTINPKRVLEFRNWDDEFMAQVIGKVVERMKGLHKFRLISEICCQNHDSRVLMAWGNTLRWEIIVEHRHERKKIRDFAEVVKKDAIARYVKKRL